MFFTRPEDFKIKQLAPGVVSQLSWGERVMLSYATAKAGSVLPEHSHPHEQMGLVIEGEIEFTIGGETKTLTRGMTFLVPPGVPHRAAFPKACVVLDVFSPPREDFIKG